MKLEASYNDSDWYESFPSRERGLKQVPEGRRGQSGFVAPFAGAWIETFQDRAKELGVNVAPFAGAWIETLHSRKCHRIVAPFAGAWIETNVTTVTLLHFTCRSLRGSVD